MNIVIQSCLTERKLAAALRELVGDQWAGGQVAIPGFGRRFDMAFRTNTSTVLVEYDGDEHYRNSMKIKADQEKDVLASENRMRLVRIPYWVQLDSMMARHWFGLEANIEQSFPHGFITTKLFPASFCELGVGPIPPRIGCAARAGSICRSRFPARAGVRAWYRVRFTEGAAGAGHRLTNVAVESFAPSGLMFVAS